MTMIPAMTSHQNLPAKGMSNFGKNLENTNFEEVMLDLENPQNTDLVLLENNSDPFNETLIEFGNEKEEITIEVSENPDTDFNSEEPLVTSNTIIKEPDLSSSKDLDSLELKKTPKNITDLDTDKSTQIKTINLNSNKETQAQINSLNSDKETQAQINSLNSDKETQAQINNLDSNKSISEKTDNIEQTSNKKKDNGELRSEIKKSPIFRFDVRGYSEDELKEGKLTTNQQNLVGNYFHKTQDNVKELPKHDPRFSLGKPAEEFVNRPKITIDQQVKLAAADAANWESKPEDIKTRTELPLKQVFHQTQKEKPFHDEIKIPSSFKFVQPQPETETPDKIQQHRDFVQKFTTEGGEIAREIKTLKSDNHTAGIARSPILSKATTEQTAMNAAIVNGAEGNREKVLDTKLEKNLALNKEIDSGDSFISASEKTHINQREALTQSTNESNNTSSKPYDLDQIISHMKNLKDRQDNEITLQLTPDHLGKLTMRMKQEGNNFNVEMMVDNAAARQWIENNMHDLKQRFLSNDLEFNQMNVSVDVGEQFVNSGGTNEQGGYEEDHIGNNQKNRIEAEIPVTQTKRINKTNQGLNIYI